MNLAPLDQEGRRLDAPERKRARTTMPDCFNCGHEAALHDVEETGGTGLGPCAAPGCECPVYRARPRAGFLPRLPPQQGPLQLVPLLEVGPGRLLL